MAADNLKFVEIVDLCDDLLPPWLDLYEVAFPPAEKVLVSSHLRLLKNKALGLADNHHLLGAVNREGELVAMARYERQPSCSAAYLWYLAVVAQARCRGIGSEVYREILRRLEAHACRALLFEVEIPEPAGSAEQFEFAVRRIQFYQRLGAALIQGIDYTQSVGSHQPPIPMHLMIHPFAPMDGLAAFELARQVFGDEVKLAGLISLERGVPVPL